MSVRARLFDADRDDHEIELGSSLPDIGERQLLWVDVEAEDEDRLAELSELLGLTADTVDLLKSPSSTPRITAFPEYVQVTVAVLPDGSGEKPAPLDLVAGHNFVLTVHPGPVALLNDFDEGSAATRTWGSWMRPASWRHSSTATSRATFGSPTTSRARSTASTPEPCIRGRRAISSKSSFGFAVGSPESGDPSHPIARCSPRCRGRT